MELKDGLSGFVVTRNCIENDYCYLQAVLSLASVCDEILVCDSDSTDGTREFLDYLAEVTKVRIINYPFKEATGDREWYDRWLNYARSHLSHKMMLQLDADEVLGEWQHSEIRQAVHKGECRMIKHINFWRDARHTTIHGDGMFARLAPTRYYMPSHGAIPEGEVNIREEARKLPPIGEIFHMSMLRKKDAFFKKQRFMLKTLEGTTDQVLEEAEKDGQDYMTYKHDKVIEEFKGEHPVVIQGWLKERGWSLE